MLLIMFCRRKLHTFIAMPISHIPQIISEQCSELYYFFIRTRWIHFRISYNDMKKIVWNYDLKIYFLLHIREDDIKQGGIIFTDIFYACA
jgi:hypothetical protein